MRIVLTLLVLATAACSAGAESDPGSAEAEGALKAPVAPVYLGQAPLTTDPSTLYNKLTVLPSVVSNGAKVTGPNLFGIVCSNQGDEPCTLNWMQRSDRPPTAFFVTGAVAKSIFLALPAADRTYEDAGVRFRCDVQKGGLLSSDLYSCAFSGLTATLQEVSGSVMITPRVELKESDARAAADNLFPKM